ncbi:hypothetical protein [Jiulongibacter sediminis]|uniref:hypothetical protein n=1 Tax=Jiulongibacter sediminis TaxID=1605367 RepID=UPI0026EC7B93|nr:hypothetical protein [Jiulongibacter sediminis]
MRIPISLIRVITVLYISFSLFPFFLGWVRPVYGIPLSLMLIWGLYQHFKNLDFTKREFYPAKQLIVFLIILFLWVSFSGSGGMGYQVSDLYKSNTLVKELTNRSWPLDYDVDGNTMYLAHYLSYYIATPTLFGFLGFKAAQFALFFYTYLGVVLSFFWMYRFVKGNLIGFSFFLIVFGGVTTLSIMLSQDTSIIEVLKDKILNHGYLFWLNSWETIPLNFMSVTDMLYWTPQHALAAFLGVGLILNDGFVDDDIRYLPFVLSLLAMWSPMVLVGLFPLLVFVLLKFKFSGFWNYTNLLIAPVFFLVQASYLLSIESEELVKNFIFTDMSAEGVSILKQVGIYLYFLFFEVFIWAVPIYLILRNQLEKVELKLLFHVVFMLSVIPLYRFGLWNDWCTRVSMGCLLTLALFGYKALISGNGYKKVALFVILIMGGKASLVAIGGSAKHAGYRPNFLSPEEQQVLSLPEICVGYPITQFVAPDDTFFFKYLAKEKAQ